MAPVTETSTSDADTRFLIHAIAALDEFKVDSKAIAASENINHSNNVYPKFQRVLKKHGYKWENKKVMKLGEHASQAKPVQGTPKKVVGGKKKTTDDETGEDAVVEVETQPKTPAKKAAIQKEAASTPGTGTGGQGVIDQPIMTPIKENAATKKKTPATASKKRKIADAEVEQADETTVSANGE